MLNARFLFGHLLNLEVLFLKAIKIDIFSFKISFLPLPGGFDCGYLNSEESDLQKHSFYKHCQAHY